MKKMVHFCVIVFSFVLIISANAAEITSKQMLSETEKQSLTILNDHSFNRISASGEKSVGKSILLFIPDRLLDIFDMFSIGIIAGPGGGAEVHITRWAALGIESQIALGVYWYYNRNLMAAPCTVSSMVCGPYQMYSMRFVGSGTGWREGQPDGGGKEYSKAGKFSYEDPIVRDGWIDPWGVGVGRFAEIHPIEIADFFTGLFTLGFVDIS